MGFWNTTSTLVRLLISFFRSYLTSHQALPGTVPVSALDVPCAGGDGQSSPRLRPRPPRPALTVFVVWGTVRGEDCAQTFCPLTLQSSMILTELNIEGSFRLHESRLWKGRIWATEVTLINMFLESGKLFLGPLVFKVWYPDPPHHGHLGTC